MNPLRAMGHADVSIAHLLWVHLFPMAWNRLDKSKRDFMAHFSQPGFTTYIQCTGWGGGGGGLNAWYQCNGDDYTNVTPRQPCGFIT